MRDIYDLRLFHNHGHFECAIYDSMYIDRGFGAGGGLRLQTVHTGWGQGLPFISWGGGRALPAGIMNYCSPFFCGRTLRSPTR